MRRIPTAPPARSKSNVPTKLRIGDMVLMQATSCRSVNAVTTATTATTLTNRVSDKCVHAFCFVGELQNTPKGRIHWYYAPLDDYDRKKLRVDEDVVAAALAQALCDMPEGTERDHTERGGGGEENEVRNSSNNSSREDSSSSSSRGVHIYIRLGSSNTFREYHIASAVATTDGSAETSACRSASGPRPSSRGAPSSSRGRVRPLLGSSGRHRKKGALNTADTAHGSATASSSPGPSVLLRRDFHGRCSGTTSHVPNVLQVGCDTEEECVGTSESGRSPEEPRTVDIASIASEQDLDHLCVSPFTPLVCTLDQRDKCATGMSASCTPTTSPFLTTGSGSTHSGAAHHVGQHSEVEAENESNGSNKKHSEKEGEEEEEGHIEVVRVPSSSSLLERCTEVAVVAAVMVDNSIPIVPTPPPSRVGVSTERLDGCRNRRLTVPSRGGVGGGGRSRHPPNGAMRNRSASSRFGVLSPLQVRPRLMRDHIASDTPTRRSGSSRLSVTSSATIE